MKWTVVYTAGVFRVRGDGKLTNEAGVFIDEDYEALILSGDAITKQRGYTP
jgi:hypothetical protein